MLHLGEVVFIDSSGLGTMVRTLTSTRQVRGDLKLCHVPEHVQKVLQLSHLTKLFDSHESEDNAVASFYRARAPVEQPVSAGKSVLCVDTNADVVTYLRELLHRAGYDVHTSNNLRDGLILMRVTRFDLVLLGAGMSASPTNGQSFPRCLLHRTAGVTGKRFLDARSWRSYCGTAERNCRAAAIGATGVTHLRSTCRDEPFQ